LGKWSAQVSSLAGGWPINLRRMSPMTSAPQRLRFGIFLAPFHKPGINPTLALQSDLELVQWLDRCGYDEAWFGEHPAFMPAIRQHQ
jgi:hypothetical protein